ncbi:Ig-like domain-containing protein [Marinoscillum furvescens]|uniref:Putative secreted protein (Por secretion system target) n=1 Tax=Marinoscillum furvescens DSM 4134 TaxID=1122208 RepID=A0A3D9KZI2_MARFU|nr:Ig-like domain-containing protein [Marinoscillum furvescens]RED95968.1 putative secreted protein (Por secretion system target) [Marinoscillum furvescens DSM 4134]
MRIINYVILIASFVVAWPHVGVAQEFIHPGGLFKQSDLDRMRYMVEAGVEPYATSFEQLKATNLASYDYKVQGSSSNTRVTRNGENSGAYHSDANAAYHNALMWAITGDTRHADKCVEIFNAWKNITYVGGIPLDAGIFAWKMVEAAEIIKSTYDGWTASDIKAFQDMLVYPGYSSTAIPEEVNSETVGSFYWRILNGDSGRHGNQDAISFRAMAIMGVFLDNRKMYDRAYRYLTSQPGRTDDLPLPTGPSPSGRLIDDNQYFSSYEYVGSEGTIENYGYNGAIEHFIWENGQCQEASRDQQHAYFGLGILSGFAEVAWNQGDDAWNFLDNRLLKGYEHMSRYNVSYIRSFEDQPTPWEPDPNVGSGENAEFIQRIDRTGRWYSKAMNPHFSSNFEDVSRGGFPGKRPVYEQAWAHFDVRMGIGEDAKWTKRGLDVAIEEAGYEQIGFSLDHPGWGALCFRRPVWAAGDPITGIQNGIPVFGFESGDPIIIQAENYDHFPISGEGRTYHDLSEGNSGGQYRTDDVDIQLVSGEDFALANLQNGEWVSYTLNIPESGTYGISVNYASASGGGKVKFAGAGLDLTEEVTLPATGGGTTYVDFTVSENVKLAPGVSTFRVYIAGEDDSFSLNSFSVFFVKGNEAPDVSITSPTTGAVLTEGASLQIAASAEDSDGKVSKVEFFLGEDKIGEDDTAPFELDLEYLAEGTYEFFAKATDDSKASTLSAGVTVTVNANQQASSSKQLVAIADTYVHSGNSGQNYGTDVKTVTKWSSVDHRYAFYKFDIRGVFGPITSAKLKLSVRAASSSTRSVYRVYDDSWEELVLNHGNQPTVGSEVANIAITSSQANTYVEWDVTDYVKIENSTDGIVTFVIADPETTSTGIDFHSRERAEDQYKPLLDISFKGTSNQEPVVSITSPSAGDSFVISEAITIEAEATDSDGTIELVAFFSDDVKIGEATSAPYSITWSDAEIGEYSLTAVATDNIGSKVTSEAVYISVTPPPNEIPSASITSPAEGSVFEIGENIKVEVSATDTDGAIARVEIYRGDVKLGEDSSEPYSAVWLNATEGEYQLKAIAIDDDGDVGQSEIVNITVGEVAIPLNAMKEDAIVVFPNPVKNVLFLEGVTSNMDYRILDIAGAVQLQGTCQQSGAKIDVSSLRTGVYFVELLADESKIQRKKIIKQ